MAFNEFQDNVYKLIDQTDSTGLENKRAKILEEISLEATRACELHGPMNSLHEAYGVIKEEFEEWWEEVKKNPKKLSTLQAATRRKALREEMIQMAAMCVKTIESLNL